MRCLNISSNTDRVTRTVDVRLSGQRATGPKGTAHNPNFPRQSVCTLQQPLDVQCSNIMLNGFFEFDNDNDVSCIAKISNNVNFGLKVT